MSKIIEFKHDVPEAMENIKKQKNIDQARSISAAQNSYVKGAPNPFIDMEFQKPMTGVNKIKSTKGNPYNVGLNVTKK